ncbi:MAG: archaemetzincin family Zn-dependent metalloprotease [Ignisphaera sp.]|nr:archaemetzincin family Zn-dependent metalloprotease [Ignisphaera sp.]MCX8167459.1 archaemetzincin family Zn-dependent metalloprotease [Ignisphaera sp.]MDW8084677.1 archaemetzincin family Zn-dependent metalloprotease [Ignisphaera sp.]
MLIQLFRTRNVDERILEDVALSLHSIFMAEVEIQNYYIELPDNIFDSERMQYLADAVIYHVYKYKSLAAVAIVLVGFDAYIKGLNFVFGLAIPHLKTAAVFLPRLAAVTQAALFPERIRKEVVHELGHILGLKHCSRINCVMSFSNSVTDIDRKTVKFCHKCGKILESKGYRISREFLLL